MQKGRGYRQIKPWALCENFPPRYRTPVAIFPTFNFVYAGLALSLPDQVQTAPPDVRLIPGVVQWRGKVSSSAFTGVWIIEQLRQDFTPNLIFSAVVTDGFGSTYAQHFLWKPGEPTWMNVPFFGFFNPYDTLYTGGFSNGGLVSMRPRTYHEEP